MHLRKRHLIGVSEVAAILLFLAYVVLPNRVVIRNHSGHKLSHIEITGYSRLWGTQGDPYKDPIVIEDLPDGGSKRLWLGRTHAWIGIYGTIEGSAEKVGFNEQALLAGRYHLPKVVTFEKSLGCSIYRGLHPLDFLRSNASYF